VPYTTKKLPNGKIAIIKKSGEQVGKSDSRSMAVKAMAARYANEKGKGGKDDDEKEEKEEETKKKDKHE
jgi:hypothetical protein